MAREIFLLGYDETSGPETLPATIETWAKKLGKLGVGAFEDARPVIFRPGVKPYPEIAGDLFNALSGRAIYGLGSDEEPVWAPWKLPLNGPVQMAACLSAISRRVPHGLELEKSYRQQRIILASSALSDEFQRLIPDGTYTETLNLEMDAPLYSYVYRSVSPDAGTA